MSDLSRAEIVDRIASRGSLRGLNLVRADLSDVEMVRADLAEANLRMACLNGADLREARLSGSHLSGALVNEADLTGANLVEANMIGVSLKNSNLSRADLSGADLTGASLEGANLEGTYLVGAFLNETHLTGADLTGAYIRLAQMSGCDLTGASLEGADLSQADLSGSRLDGSSMVGCMLANATLLASSLVHCDLRGANLTGADMTGCNLTGVRLHGVKVDQVKLDDAWAEWIDISHEGNGTARCTFEEAFLGVLGKPLCQILIEGRIEDHVWAVIIDHIAAFHRSNREHEDVKLRSINQGSNASVLYIEAETELSLAAYLSEFADIMGKGSTELFEKLASVIPARNTAGISIDLWDDEPTQIDELLNKTFPISESGNGSAAAAAPMLRQRDDEPPVAEMTSVQTVEALTQVVTDLKLIVRVEKLEGRNFSDRAKAVVVLSGNRRIWLEASSNQSLTLRPPHGVMAGLDIIRGRFVTDETRRRYYLATQTPTQPLDES